MCQAGGSISAVARYSKSVARAVAHIGWRAVNAPQLVAFVRAGATFKNGVLVERDDEQSGEHDRESGGGQQVA